MTELSVLAAAEEVPERPGLVTEDRVWSFSELAERVREEMESISAAGARNGDPVAITADLDETSLVRLYALFELGCPVVLLHPRLSHRERALVLRAAKPSLVVEDRSLARVHSHRTRSPESVPDERALALVQTSGSRGAPRLVVLSRRAFLASSRAHAANLGWQPDERWLLCMPPAHVGGLSILTRSLIARRCVVVGAPIFDARSVARQIVEHDVTLLSLVPTMLRRLVALDNPRWSPPASLRAVLIGGAPLPAAVRTQAVERGIPILATYGSTETCSQVTTQNVSQIGSVGSGAPLSGIEIRIVDGEIQVRGEILMDGYLGEDLADSPIGRDGWFRTGDLGKLLPDGQLWVGGRMDDLIITGGENVSPLEVEDWLRSVPGVRGAAVFSVPSDDWGEEVVAALVADPAELRMDALRARLARELAAHKRPKQVCFLEELPLNRSGKIDRAALRSACVNKLEPI